MKPVLKISFLIILLAIVVTLGFYGTNVKYYTTNQIALFLEINSLLSREGIRFWSNVTALGDALVLFPLLSFLIFKNTRAWAAFFGAIPLSTVLSHSGKAFFSIPRPAAIIDTEKFTVIGGVLKGATSLPSGHTITIFTMASAILYIVLRKKKTRHPVIWCIALVIFASIVALSRVAVGAHWPFDLLLGAIFGFLGGFSGAALTFKYTRWWHWMTVPKYRYIHVIVLLALTTAMIVEYSQLLIAWLSLIVVTLVTIKLVLPEPKEDYELSP